MLGDIFEKNCAQIIWAMCFRKKCVQRQKIRPNGEISPNLVTLQLTLPDVPLNQEITLSRVTKYFFEKKSPNGMKNRPTLGQTLFCEI
jgi:hypothetical protein